MIHLDTSLLIEALTGPGRAAPALRAAIASGERLSFSTIVLYEWLHGPRREAELHAQEQLFPREAAVPFGPEEAAVAAKLHTAIRRARGREIDLAIASCALTRHAALWTVNADDFRDVPGLLLYEP